MHPKNEKRAEKRNEKKTMSRSVFGKILHLGVPAKEFLKRVYYNTAERVDISDYLMNNH